MNFIPNDCELVCVDMILGNINSSFRSYELDSDSMLPFSFPSLIR